MINKTMTSRPVAAPQMFAWTDGWLEVRVTRAGDNSVTDKLCGICVS